MLAFAGNSIFCRLALAGGGIDPGSFTLLRLISGSAMLALIVAMTRSRPWARAGSWRSALALAVYASAFSFAYVHLQAGTGAFLLFASVQVTMVLAGFARGSRLAPLQWLGLIVALGGLAALVAPGVSAPDPASAALMIVAGVAWGGYSLLGRGETDALLATAGNFMRGQVLVALMLVPVLLYGVEISAQGLLFAVLSGALASGAGYAIWYSALADLAPVEGASVQLSVPVLTALLGAVLLSEPLTLRFSLSSVVIVAGILLVIFAQRGMK
ncbi:MAG: DMT family transporter [Devosia sp.]|nr:MAG: DMT family transporter [Devosia sp.]